MAFTMKRTVITFFIIGVGLMFIYSSMELQPNSNASFVRISDGNITLQQHILSESNLKDTGKSVLLPVTVAPFVKQQQYFEEHSRNTNDLSVFGLIEARIKEATAKWEALENKQSKTLSEATDEYRRRYKRNPPSRFSEWYAFAVQRGYILIDEFDSLNADLEPFRCINASDFRRRLELATEVAFTVTYRIVKGHINVTWDKSIDRNVYGSFIDLYKHAFHRLITEMSLPDLVFTYSLTNGSRVYAPFDSIQQCSPVAHTTPERMNMIHLMRSACPPNSPLKTGNITVPINPLRRDWSSLSDICEESSLVDKHGYVHLKQSLTVNTLLPIMSVSKTSHSQDIRIPSPYYWTDSPIYKYDAATDTKWAEKIPKAYWRGSSTGIWDSMFWPNSHRHRLVHFANTQQSPGELTRVQQYEMKDGKVFETSILQTRSFLQDTMLNVAFYRATQCTEEEAIRMKQIYRFAYMEPMEVGLRHAFLLDVDGNTYSTRFSSLLRSNSVVIKSTIFHEWFSELLLPWFHFVPLSLDYSEIYDVLSWFQGIKNSTFSNMAMGHQISIQASRFVQRHLRAEDHIVYLYRLLIELADMMGHIKSG